MKYPPYSSSYHNIKSLSSPAKLFFSRYHFCRTCLPDRQAIKIRHFNAVFLLWTHRESNPDLIHAMDP